MKKLKRIFALSLVLTSLISCSSDDDDNSNEVTENYMQVGSETYELNFGGVINYGNFGGGPNEFDFVFTTTSASIHDEEFIPDENEYSGVQFSLYTSNTEDVNTGTYNYDDDMEAPGTFDFGMCILNFNYEEETAEYLDVVGGQVEVVKNGNPYELNFNFELENGESLEGHYEGNLYFEDASE